MINFIKKIVLITFLITAIFVIDFNIQVEAESEPVVYLSAAEYGYPPFSMETDGQADGFSVQLLKEVAIEMGITIEFKMDYWAIIKQELIDGQLDVLPLVGYTLEREETLDFTIPYIVMRGNIFVREGDNQIQSVDDLFDKQVLVLAGDNSEEYARSIGLDEELITTTTYKEAFELLSSGQYDAILAQGLVGQKIMSDENITNINPVYVFDDDGISKIKLNLEGYEQKFCFAVTEGNDELLSILNEGLSIISANGTYDRLYQEWFPFLIDNSRSFIDLVVISVAIITPLIIVTLALSVIIVRKQVKSQTEKIVKTALSNQVILEAFEKKFHSDQHRYDFFLQEALKLSSSSDGVMFTFDKKKKVSINAACFKETELVCSYHELEKSIEKTIKEMKKLVSPIQIMFNDYEKKKHFIDLNVYCFKNIRHVLILSFYTESGDMFYTLIANKKDSYNEDDLTQLSLLISGFVSMIDRSNYLKQVEYLSYHDSLTNLYNRRYVEERMIELDKHKEHPISIIFADVNRLKEINDRYGHMQGDKLLIATGQLLQEHCNKKDIVVRWGGDEFVIIKPQTENTNAQHYVEFVSDSALKTDLETGVISISFGCSTKTDDSKSLKSCLIEAEQKMYENKTKINGKYSKNA